VARSRACHACAHPEVAGTPTRQAWAERAAQEALEAADRVPIHVQEGLDELGEHRLVRLGSRRAGSPPGSRRPRLLLTGTETFLAQTDHFGVQSTLDQFSDLLVWGLVCVIVVCFAVAVWSVYKNSRGRTRSVTGHRRMGE
jgi:hypothetical protein